MKIKTQECIVCHQIGTVEVPDSAIPALEQWLAGSGFIQDLLPMLNAGEREQLMTGTHPKCWDKMFIDEGV